MRNVTLRNWFHIISRTSVRQQMGWDELFLVACKVFIHGGLGEIIRESLWLKEVHRTPVCMGPAVHVRLHARSQAEPGGDWIWMRRLQSHISQMLLLLLDSTRDTNKQLRVPSEREHRNFKLTFVTGGRDATTAFATEHTTWQHTRFDVKTALLTATPKRYAVNWN